MEKYGLELVDFGEKYYMESMIATLTGLDLEDILAVRAHQERWRGGEITQLITDLGYNTNPRFIKFDRNTEFPCLMRSHDRFIKSGNWYGFVYYDGMVGCNGYTEFVPWSQFNMDNPNLRVTTMLQVWI